MNKINARASNLATICLTIIGTVLAQPVFAATLQQCIADVCKEKAPAVGIGSFLALENKIHPGLEEFYRRYQSTLNQIRIAREKQVRESVQVLGETQKITESIRRMSDQDLMSLFVERQPWNLGTDRINGRYVVACKPLSADAHIGSVIKALFPRLLTASSLYAAQLKMSQLNAEPRAALNLVDGQKTDLFVLNEIKRNIAKLLPAERAVYTQKLNQQLAQFENFKVQYGEKLYLFLGELDLEVQIKLGRVTFQDGERATIEQLMISDIPGVIHNRQKGIAAIDQIYSPAKWEKTCRSAYNRTLHYGLTPAEKDLVENVMKPEALRRSEITFRHLFGPELTSEIMTYVRTMQISAPMSLPEYIQMIEQNMSRALAMAKRTDLSLLDHYHMVNGLGNDKDGALEGLCNGWIFDPARDSVSGNHVILSSYSAKNYGVGISISVHEIAHAASVALDLLKHRGVSITPYEDIRTCISKNYEASSRKAEYDHSRFNADKLWTEEDWADAFAGYAIRDLNIIDMCGILGAAPELDYVKLKDRKTDTHSPTFYRILNIDMHQGGRGADQCREPLKNHLEETNFKDCISPLIR